VHQLKITIFFIGLIIHGATSGQSQLPACSSDRNTYWHNCFGTASNKSGDKYVGEWRDNMLNGQGTETFADGTKYVGELRNGKHNGQGAFTHANGDKYVGQFKDGKYEGQGTYTFTSGEKYVGQHKENNRHGQGTYTFTSGKKYVGEFRDGKYNGKGTLYEANGSIINQGIWEDDKFIRSESVQQASPPNQDNSKELKRQKCVKLGLVPGSADFQLCMK